MDRQVYLRRLRARIEHIDAALSRSLGLDAPGSASLDRLRGHASEIEEAGEGDWHGVRQDVERSFGELHAELHHHGTVMEEVAKSVRDGAAELFRGEPSEISKQLEALRRS